jgi:hypothetical protein
MNKKDVRPILCWIVIGSLFFAITILPMIVGIPSNAGIIGQRTTTRAFISFILCYPYIRAAIFFSKESQIFTAKFIPLSEYQKNNMAWAYYFELIIPILASLIVFFLVLSNLTEYLTGFHYLAILLYGISVTLLEISIDKAIPRV